MTLSSSGVAAACGTEPCGSPPCGSGPRPRKGGLQPPGRIPEAFIVPVSGAPYPRRGAMVVPSGIAQAVPGRSHLAIPGQIGSSRHQHCPAHWVASPPRVTTPPAPQVGKLGISQGAPGSGGPVQDRVWPGMAKRRAYMDVLVACPGRAHPIPVRALWRERSLASCRELRSLSRAGPAPTKPRRYWFPG